MMGLRHLDPAHTYEPRHIGDDLVKAMAHALAGCARLDCAAVRNSRYRHYRVDLSGVTRAEYHELDKAALETERRRVGGGAI